MIKLTNIMHKYNFSIIIPAFNEEQNIPELLHDLDNCFKGIDSVEIILVDDGSTVSLKDVVNTSKYTFDLKVLTNRFNLGQSESIKLDLVIPLVVLSD